MRRAVLAVSLFCALPAALAQAAEPPEAPGHAVAPAGAVLRDAPDGDAVREAGPRDILTATGETDEVGGARWAAVSQGDGPDLWAEAGALAPAPLETFPGSLMPVAGACFGSEPSWSVRWDAESLSFREFMDDPQRSEARPATVVGWRHGTLLSDDWTLLYEAAACPFTPVDGLVWGRGALVETGGERRVFYGCCRPAPEALR